MENNNTLCNEDIHCILKPSLKEYLNSLKKEELLKILDEEYDKESRCIKRNREEIKKIINYLFKEFKTETEVCERTGYNTFRDIRLHNLRTMLLNFYNTLLYV